VARWVAVYPEMLIPASKTLSAQREYLILRLLDVADHHVEVHHAEQLLIERRESLRVRGVDHQAVPSSDHETDSAAGIHARSSLPGKLLPGYVAS
jgi:hypothetical protein